MNIVDCRNRLPQNAGAYAVLVKPRTGLHYPIETGVTWSGSAWMQDGKPFNDTWKEVVAWVDPLPEKAVEIPTVDENDLPCSYDVVLVSVDPVKRVGVIRLIREILGLGFAESKAFAEKCPQVVKDNVDQATAESLRQRFEEAGGRVELRETR